MTSYKMDLWFYFLFFFILGKKQIELFLFFLKKKSKLLNLFCIDELKMIVVIIFDILFKCFSFPSAFVTFLCRIMKKLFCYIYFLCVSNVQQRRELFFFYYRFYLSIFLTFKGFFFIIFFRLNKKL